MPKVLVFNGWAAGPEAWLLTTFPRDWTFSYIEELDGLPEWVMEDSDEVILVGFSMGGSMALGTYLKYPEKVKGMVLVSATPCMLEKKSEGWAGMSERRFRAFAAGVELMFGEDPAPWYEPKQLARGLEYLLKTDLRKDLEGLLGDAAGETHRGTKPVPCRGTKPVPCRGAMPAPCRGAMPAPYRGASSPAASPSNLSSIPVHIFHSTRDGVVRPQNAAYLKSLFPQAKVTMVEGTEHVLPVTIPEQIDAAVNEILDGLESLEGQDWL